MSSGEFVPILKTEGGTSNVDLDWYSSDCYSHSAILPSQAEELEFESLTVRLLPKVPLRSYFTAGV